MEERPVSTRISAEKAVISPTEIKPQELAAFIFLHELGHSLYYLKEKPVLEEMKANRDEELKTLPVPGWNPVDLKGSHGIELWTKNSQAYIDQGIPTHERLVDLQKAAYHSIGSEDYPDRFAARVLGEFRKASAK